MRSKRFVLDANIWVSYFIKNNLSVLTETVAINKIRLLYCDELLLEIETVLNYPHLLKYKVEIKKAVGFIKKIGIFAQLVYPIKQYIPDDENDSYIIALALQQNAGFVTSGDNVIFFLKKQFLKQNIKRLIILTKAQFEGIFYN